MIFIPSNQPRLGGMADSKSEPRNMFKISLEDPKATSLRTGQAKIPDNFGEAPKAQRMDQL